MDTIMNLPGTSGHQQILQTILNYYEDDPRIMAILLFGSLGRGNWDIYSDLDLDIITVDDTVIDAGIELGSLCQSIKNEFGFEALVIADVEEGDVVLSNLLEFSIRFHELADTKPAILDSMRHLSGNITLDEVVASANEDYRTVPMNIPDSISQCVRYTVGLHKAIRRQRIWMSLELLHRIRAILMSIYSSSHDADRPVQFFDAHAEGHDQDLLTNLVSRADMESLWAALANTISLLQDHLAGFTNGQYELTKAHMNILQTVELALLEMKE